MAENSQPRREQPSNTAPLPNALVTKVGEIYRNESRRIFATLVGLLRDFDLAEDALQDAFRAAIEQWPRDGIPDNPRAWLVSTGRFKAIDKLRRKARMNGLMADIAARLEQEAQTGRIQLDDDIPDERLRLIFTCCHPLLSLEARVAMTLREVCGLSTEAIAHAFLTSPPTLAQRIVRAKKKIRKEQIPYETPSHDALPERLGAVLQVIYLVFNEGYAASSGPSLTRPDLSGEAIRLGRLLADLLPHPEATGLLALMLLLEARRAARATNGGAIIPLEEQNRSLWDRERIAEGTALAQKAFASGQLGPYTLQAAIAAVHAAAETSQETDWRQIVGLYDLLLRVAPSPVVEISRAVAVAMRDDPATGLALVDEILARGDLAGYHLAHAARADLCRRLGQTAAAQESYERALSLANQEPERRFLAQRLGELQE